MMKIEEINRLEKSSLGQIIKLHNLILDDSVLNKLGNDFLEFVYQEFAESDNKILLVVWDKKSIVGVLAASVDSNGFYKELLSKSIWFTIKIAWNVVYQRRPLLLPILKLLFFSKKTPFKAELYFLAVNSKLQRKGIGTKLIRSFSEELAKRRVKNFIVPTKAENVNSNNFYKKLGFKYLYDEIVLGEKLNFYLSPSAFGKS